MWEQELQDQNINSVFSVLCHILHLDSVAKIRIILESMKFIFLCFSFVATFLFRRLFVFLLLPFYVQLS
mgnify:CR=1 FL=1